MRKDLINLGVDPDIIAVIRHAIRENPSLKSKSPYEVFKQVMSMSDNDIATQYNEYIKKPIIKGLEEHLK
jgi:hypothetical protein